MSLTIPLVAADFATSTITLADPVIGTPTTFNIGETAILGTPDSGNGNLLVTQGPYTLTSPATPVSLSMYFPAVAGQVYLGIVDATGHLVATTAVFTPVVGWNTKPVVSPVQIPAGVIRLAYTPSSSSLNFVKATTSGVSNTWVARTFAALPAIFPALPNSDPAHWSFYATFSGTQTPPPPASPTITSITPNPAPAGQVTVNGTNFIAGATVSFGGTAVGVTVVSATQLTCVAPAHADGSVAVTVTTTVGTSAAFTFTYQASAPPPPTYVFQDEFNGPAGSKPTNPAWLIATWFEPPNSVFLPDNVFLDGNSNLVLRVTSNATAKIQSNNAAAGSIKVGHTFEARIKFLLANHGTGQAFWLLGDPNTQNEIDICENFGNVDWLPAKTTVWTGDHNTPIRADLPFLDSNWHTWRCEWTTAGLKFWFDWVAGKPPYLTVVPSDIPTYGFNDATAAMFIILSAAHGNTGDGTVDSTTILPADMLVDWVHVWVT
jgi:hypothetical protein